MNTAVATEDTKAPEPAAREPRDTWLYVAIAVLVGAAWFVGRGGFFQASDDLSYWIAVVGGSMMLVLMLYPLRKYLRVLRNVGRVKGWFVMHMVLGVAGPWLILVHSTFRIGSLNAGVALISMVIVVLSGVVGRFIYVRVHRGLSGERTTLRDLQARAGFVESDARSKLSFAPVVEDRLAAFERDIAQGPTGLVTQLRHVMWLPLQQRLTYRLCVQDLEAPLKALAEHGHWSAEDLARRRRQARKLVQGYLNAVVRVAQYTAYERVFALWHVAHLPFVILLVVSAVVHVVAVHAY